MEAQSIDGAIAIQVGYVSATPIDHNEVIAHRVAITIPNKFTDVMMPILFRGS